MHSRARLTYTQVWNWLAAPKPTRPACRPRRAAAAAPRQPLRALPGARGGAREARRDRLRHRRAAARVRRAAARSSAIVPAPRNDAHKLIEECMLAANVCTAEFLAKAQAPGALPRARGADAGEARALREFLGELRARARRRRRARRRPTTRSCCSRIKDRPDYALLQTVLLRSLQQAQYRPDNVGHFGLSYEAYAHFTSPIRRYPGPARPPRDQGGAGRRARTGRAARRGRSSACTAR